VGTSVVMSWSLSGVKVGVPGRSQAGGCARLLPPVFRIRQSVFLGVREEVGGGRGLGAALEVEVLLALPVGERARHLAFGDLDELVQVERPDAYDALSANGGEP